MKKKKKKRKSPFKDGTYNDVEIVVHLKYLHNFWETLEMLLINSKINLLLTCSTNCIISFVAGTTTFTITDGKLYVPLVILWVQDFSKFNQTTNWIKY